MRGNRHSERPVRPWQQRECKGRSRAATSAANASACAAPPTTWVNALDGQPFFCVTQPIDPGLIKTLEDEIITRQRATFAAHTLEPTRSNPTAAARHETRKVETLAQLQ